MSELTIKDHGITGSESNATFAQQMKKAVENNFLLVKRLEDPGRGNPIKQTWLAVIKCAESINLARDLFNSHLSVLDESKLMLLYEYLRVVRFPKSQAMVGAFKKEGDVLFQLSDAFIRNQLITIGFQSPSYPLYPQIFLRGGRLEDYFTDRRGAHAIVLTPPFAWYLLTALVEILIKLRNGYPEKSDAVPIQHGRINAQNLMFDINVKHWPFPGLRLIGFGSATLATPKEHPEDLDSGLLSDARDVVKLGNRIRAKKLEISSPSFNAADNREMWNVLAELGDDPEVKKVTTEQLRRLGKKCESQFHLNMSRYFGNKATSFNPSHWDRINEIVSLPELARAFSS